jgi:anti-sigma B factor antagonist
VADRRQRPARSGPEPQAGRNARLRCLVSAWRRAKAGEGSLVLCGLNERLREIFSMVGFDKVFDIHDDCAAARGRARTSTRT